MSDILVAGAAEGNKPPQPKEIQATVMFQDQNYTILRNKEGATNQDILDMPIHLALLSFGMMDARNYVEKIGYKSYIKALRQVKKHFDRQFRAQLAAASKMKQERFK